MRESWIFGILVIILLSLTIFYPYLGWAVRSTVFRHPAPEASYEEVVRENHALEAALSVAESLGSSSVPIAENGRTVSVFSRYPLNFKHELLVNSGSNQGTTVGDIAVVGVSSSTMAVNGIFLGKVTQVLDNTALVQTIFDSTFESAVRVGSAGIDALLKGGNSPRITLIQRRAGVHEGEIVYVAAPNIPYGLAVGKLGTITPSSDNVFDEGSLAVGYDVNQLTTIHLIPGTSFR